MQRQFTFLSLSVSLLMLAISLPACNESSVDGKKPPLLATSVSDSATDPFALPAGDANRLLQFIENLYQHQPKSEAEAKLYTEKAPPAIEAAAKRIMAMVPDKSSDLHQQAARYVIDFRIGGMQDATPAERQQITNDVMELVRAGAKQSAEVAYQHIDRILYLITELRGVGDLELAATSLRETADIFVETGDAQLAGVAAELQSQAELVLIPSLPEDQQVAVYESIRDRIANTPAKEMGESEYNTMRILLQELEESGNVKLSTEAYRDFARILRATGKEELDADAAYFETMGQPLELAGETFSGQPFDWEPYRDKVVLVNFWATWCMPCIQKIPQLKEIHDKYRDRGFEVVTISLDEDKPKLSEFMATQGMPWTVLHHPGGQHPAAMRYHVQRLPYTLLVNEQGYVVARDPTFTELTEKLDELLGTSHGLPATATAQ